ncbi:uncharacterized protein LOC141612398 isoform X1 [Silene latifolia]|uniref:uncharacterized protein LOC141612398 isoform X1 n=1 Tax=Silene latifolia TaxID=37657 RepID=UPI003D774D5B
MQGAINISRGRSDYFSLTSSFTSEVNFYNKGRNLNLPVLFFYVCQNINLTLVDLHDPIELRPACSLIVYLLLFCSLGFRQNKLLEQTRGIITKSRLQAKQVAEADKRHHYERTFDAIMKMIHNEGLAGFY